MIVICTKCQAKFRVADDKIGPRGAKVRCSRCETVLVVRREPAPPAPDPASPPPEPSNDPFAAAAQPATADPFGGADPFAAAAPTASRSTLVTDLSDLLGPAAAPFPSAGGSAEAAPPPSDAAALAFDPAPGVAPSADPPAPPAHPAAPPASVASADDGGLALEDRLTPPPVKVPPAESPSLDGPVLDEGFDILPGPEAGQAFEAPVAAPPAAALAAAGFAPYAAAGDPFAGSGGDPFDPGSYDYAPDPAEPPVALSTEPAPAPAAPAAEAPPPHAEDPPRADRPSPPVVGPAPARRGPWFGTRLRAVVLNAVALAALLAVALAILLVSRTEGSLAPANLRPSAVIAALRGRAASHGPYAAREIRSGLYERRRGAPLLFVRGKVVSRAPGPVRALLVSVEVVRAGAVVARGEAIAGGVPTPEELWDATEPAALVQAATAARLRAPREVRPGDELPFLVAIGDAPPEIDGASLRVEVAAAGGGSR